MTSLLVLAALLIAGWIWSVWQRERGAAFMSDWSYVPLVGAIICVVMAVGLWLR
jgi:hypothetical protein